MFLARTKMLKMDNNYQLDNGLSFKMKIVLFRLLGEKKKEKNNKKQIVSMNDYQII